jgi:uncharacterized damage-inducible protein DinB
MLAAPILHHHIEYTAWASSRLLEAAAALTPEQLTRDFGTADRSVVGTLAHVFAADRVWIGRIQGAPPATFLEPHEADLAYLREHWPRLHSRWREWAAQQSAESLATPLVYHDLKGNRYSQPLWQVVLHVVNHATHHRGQVSGFLRAMGVVPPPLDLIAYYRTQAAR